MSLTPYNEQYILILTNKHVKLNPQLIHNQGYGKIMTSTNFTDMISLMVHTAMASLLYTKMLLL